MAMLRQQFEALTHEQLLILIETNIQLIREAAKFPETENYLQAIEAHLRNVTLMDKKALQDLFKHLMALTKYWDNHQNSLGLFAPVEKFNVNQKLDDALTELKRTTRTNNMPAAP